MDEVEEIRQLYWDLNKDLIEESSKQYIEDNIKENKVIIHRDNAGKIDGFVTHKAYGENGVYLVETHFRTEDKMALLKCVSQACKGKQYVLVSTRETNEKLINCFKESKFLFMEKIGKILYFHKYLNWRRKDGR